MLGFGDMWIFCAVVGCLVATGFGIVYGAIKWNKGDEDK